MYADSRAETVRAAYGAFATVVEALDDGASWLPTGCTGWAVRDLVFHCLADAQRGLVALHTPTGRAPDRDAVTYWGDWRPDTVGAANAQLSEYHHGRRAALATE